MFKLLALSLILGLACSVQMARADELGEDGFADSDGVKIHYVTAGKGPLVVLIHGFPDYWYTWRAQIPALAEHFQVVAIDQRGYNKSDKPQGVENYALPKLVADIDAVVRHFKQDKAIIVGHDWGGIVAWTFAMTHPDKTDKLVILNLPHPRGLARELANNPDQQKNSQYARDFQQPDAVATLLKRAKQGLGLSGAGKGKDDNELIAMALTFWVKDQDARKKYIEAFKQSDYEGMLNYYKANYPREPYTESASSQLPPVKCPVLMFHGLKDKALLSGALNGTWDWIDNDLTLVTIPGADHFVQQDAAEKVTKCMVAWLTMK
ncbi:MAG: alpha/beta fold hydrolase [Pirellulales bacterium]